VSTATETARAVPVALGAGSRVGRYRIEGVIGQGGMSVVYAAHDSHLERRVALKVLRPAAAEDGAEVQQLRLVREARAMARLSHPNVVSVYDTGTFGEQVFIAMELVEGRTMGQWLREEVRPWSQVLEVFCDAGRGIAHAHEHGLVHRDFKPENVLLGVDGRVRVTDFGLARPASSPDAPPGPIVPTPEWYATSRLTQTGALAGTPAYMAPEQLLGCAPDPRTDQFGFCVALHEALYGVRPFSAATLDSLVDRILRSEVVEPPRERVVPDWVRAALLRGLSGRPQVRFGSMDELLAALSRAPRRRAGLGRVLGAMTVGAVLVVAAALGARAFAPAAPTTPPVVGGAPMVGPAPPVAVRDAPPQVSPAPALHEEPLPPPAGAVPAHDSAVLAGAAATATAPDVEPHPSVAGSAADGAILAGAAPPVADDERPRSIRRASRRHARRAPIVAAPAAPPPRRTSDDDLLP
jgi:hypothetical protein